MGAYLRPVGEGEDWQRAWGRDLEIETRRIEREAEVLAAAFTAEIDTAAEALTRRAEPVDEDESDEPSLSSADVARLVQSGPSWMGADDWRSRVTRYREQERADPEIAGIARYLDERGPRPRPWAERPGYPHVVNRDDYVAKADEERYCVRDDNGLPALRLVLAGDRLAIWSPLDGGALINPKGPGLRTIGLTTSYARGITFYPEAYRAADLRPGQPVALWREVDNPHDARATAMHAPGSRERFGFVQTGKVAAVARRMDAGEALGGVCLWGPGPGDETRSTFVIIGRPIDLTAMLGG